MNVDDEREKARTAWLSYILCHNPEERELRKKISEAADDRWGQVLELSVKSPTAQLCFVAQLIAEQE